MAVKRTVKYPTFKRGKIDGRYIEREVDFSEDECERRATELVRRACGQKAIFDFKTGQPFDGPQLSKEELERRGY